MIIKNCFKVLKRVFSAAIVMTASLAQFTSCDSREDWFAKEGEGTTFIIKSNKREWWTYEDKYELRNDTVFSDDFRIVEFDLKVNDVRWSDNYYDPGVNYSTEAVYIDFEGIGQKLNKESKTKWSVTVQLEYPNFVCDELNRCFCFLTYDSRCPVTKNDTVAPIINTADVIIELEDAFLNKLYCHVKINCLGDIPPVPVMKIKDVDGYPMEKILDLSGSYDKDGSVSMYEYCIDGNIRTYKDPIYDCDKTGYPAGKGAYGGTYVTSTAQSEIKHAFQTEGEHIVYYRCMDNLGLWSVWNSVTVAIK